MDPPAEVLLSYLYPHFIFRHPTAPQLLLPPLYSLSLPSQPLPCFSGSQSLRLGFRPSLPPLSPPLPLSASLLSSPRPTLSLSNRPRQKKKKNPASPCQAPESCTVGGVGEKGGGKGGRAEYRGGGRYRWMRRWRKERERERERELFFEGSGTMIFRPCSISRGKSIPRVARR